MSSQDLIYNAANNNQNLTEAKLDEWSTFYAKEKSGEVGHWAAAQWLVFRAGGERMTLSMNRLDEVAPVSMGVSLPQQNAAVMGVVNLRGETVILIDLACMMGLESINEVTEEQRMIFFKDENNRRTGFLVSQIDAISDLDNVHFQDDRDNKDNKGSFVEGLGEWEGSVLSLLNVNAMLRGVEEILK